MRTFILIMLAMSGLSAFSQTKAKDVFATAPDSIFPLLTTNNRLDCIDLIENNMKATVKNKLEQKAEMTALTDSYLQIKPSERSVVEIKMLNESPDSITLDIINEGIDNAQKVIYATSVYRQHLRSLQYIHHLLSENYQTFLDTPQGSQMMFKEL